METLPAAVTAGVQRQKIEFSYDAMGRRLAKKVSNWSGAAYAVVSDNRFIYDGWNLLAELNALSANIPIRTYVWGLDRSGTSQSAGGVGGLLWETLNAEVGVPSYFAVYDGNGNVSALVNVSDGALGARYDYDAFGERVLTNGPAAALNPFRFSTKYEDSESAIFYYGLRYYNPSSGRWLSRDPLGEDGGKNLYVAASNDLINKTDTLGLWAVDQHYSIIDSWLEDRKPKFPIGSTSTEYKWHCMSIDIRAQLRDGNDEVDGTGSHKGNFFHAQSTEYSYQHAMRAPNQTVDDARAKMTKFIAEEIQIAKSLASYARTYASMKNGTVFAKGMIESAIQHIGRAQHPIADMSSPQHRGFQIWYGLLVGGAAGTDLIHHLDENKAEYDRAGAVPYTAVKMFFDSDLDEILQE